MTELVNLKSIATSAQKGESCFAVFDELFSGTNAEDALEILTDTINGLSKYTNSFFIISTHIPQLKSTINTSMKQIEAYYIDCQLEENQPIFTYKLKTGWSELKIGKVLYENVGLGKIFN